MNFQFSIFNFQLRQKRAEGFTLIEMIVTIAVFTIAMVAVVGFALVLYRSQSFTFEQAAAINEARKGVETMVREIREAQIGADGAYFIEKAADNEFIFYSDIDQDDDVERIRYFLGNAGGGTAEQECVTFADGGSCSVSFTDFFTGTLQSADMTVSVEGDFRSSSEYADITADATALGRVCQSGCDDCAGVWQGSTTFDVTGDAGDNTILMDADASRSVNDICDWIEPKHAMKARFELSWTETLSGGDTDFKKGVIEPVGFPPTYPSGNEVVSVISRYVRNTSPVFRYFDSDGLEITSNPARPEETTLMRVNLLINVDPARAPESFELESDVQPRNLKTNL